MKAKTVMAIGLLMFGSLIVAFAVWTEPTGEIHETVLVFYGQTLIAALALAGLDLDALNKVFRNKHPTKNRQS